LENLKNSIDLVEEFEKEIREEEIKRVQMREEKRKKKALNTKVELYKKSELLGKYTVKILFG